jgi:hypothetical protein
MTVYKPGQGSTLPRAGDLLRGIALKKGRADAQKVLNPPPVAPSEAEGDGLIVGLVAIPGVTSSKILKQPFWFQCPPTDEMPVDITWQWTDYNTIDAGMHSNPNGQGLDVFTFSTLFVDDDPHHRFALYRDRHVLSMLRELREIGDAMTPVQLQYGQPTLWGVWDRVVGVSLRSLHITERAGEVDARYLTVSMTEFPDVPRLVAVKPPHHPGNKSGSHSGSSKNGRVLARLNSAHLPKGQRTLAEIAKRYYGSSSPWRLIAKASGLSVGPTVDLPSTVGKKKPPPQIVVPALKK